VESQLLNSGLRQLLLDAVYYRRYEGHGGDCMRQGRGRKNIRGAANVGGA
jgi:hypothetical protein